MRLILRTKSKKHITVTPLAAALRQVLASLLPCTMMSRNNSPRNDEKI